MNPVRSIMQIVFAVLLAGGMSGCMSMRVADAAQGGNDPEGKSHPAYYLLYPISLPVDLVTGPLQLMWMDYKDYQQNPVDHIDLKETLEDVLE